MRALAVVRLRDEHSHPGGGGAVGSLQRRNSSAQVPGAQNTTMGIDDKVNLLNLLLCLRSSHLCPVPPGWAHFWNRDNGFSDQDLGSEGRTGPGTVVEGTCWGYGWFEAQQSLETKAWCLGRDLEKLF